MLVVRLTKLLSFHIRFQILSNDLPVLKSLCEIVTEIVPNFSGLILLSYIQSDSSFQTMVWNEFKLPKLKISKLKLVRISSFVCNFTSIISLQKCERSNAI